MSTTAAFFDVDGTLVRSNIAHYYVYFRLRALPKGRHPFWYAWFLFKGIIYLYLDRLDRRMMNRLFYRNYKNLVAEDVCALADECFEKVIRPNLAQEGLEVIQEHRRAGRRIVLVTGSIDFIMQPLADYLQADHMEAVTLRTWDGKFTGVLDGEILGDEEKRRRVERLAAEEDIDLAGSYAYGDSIADAPMLQAVGNPVAVNPDSRLERLAAERDWRVQRWKSYLNGRHTARAPESQP